MLVITSCTKEGPAGPAGADGNANVASSNVVALNNWVSSFDNGTEFQYTSTISWGGITQAVKDNGLVMVYMRDNSTTDWTALPYSDAGSGYSLAYNFDVAVGSVVVSFNGFDNTGSPGIGTMNGVYTARIIAIPSSARKANPNLDWKDYNKVMAALHIAE